MDRTKFYEIASVDNQNELDYLRTNIANFEMKYKPLYYRVGEEDLMRPDMISYRNYNTVNYWWLIMSVNGIFDPFNDLYVGLRLMIPNILDVYDFYKKYGKR
jgi:hypothetical protein